MGILSDIENDYILIKTLDSGHFGSVFLVQDSVTNEDFAMKKIPKTCINTNTRLFSIINEIKVMRYIDHPLFIKLYKVYETETDIILIIDYCKFGTMQQRLDRKKRFSEENVLKIAIKLLEAVDYLHSLNIIHRDLKLENILMISNNDFDFKIADFGLACDKNLAFDMKCGTPGYIAPEILRGKSYTEKVDLFSCGVIIFALLAGEFPFVGTSNAQVLERNMKCVVKFNAKAWKSISFNAAEFLSLMLTAFPSIRPSAQEALMNRWISDNDDFPDLNYLSGSPFTVPTRNELLPIDKNYEISL